MSSKTRTKSRIADLYIDDNRLTKTSNDMEKAKVLSDKFSNVFVTEPDGEMLIPETRAVPSFKSHRNYRRNDREGLA